MLAGRPTIGIWQDLGLLTACFSLFLSINKACTTGWMQEHLPENVAQCKPSKNRVQDLRAYISQLGLCEHLLFVTVNSETHTLPHLNLQFLKNNLKMQRNPCHASDSSSEYFLVRYSEILLSFCNYYFFIEV